MQHLLDLSIYMRASFLLAVFLYYDFSEVYYFVKIE